MTFSYYFMFDRIVFVFGDFLPMRKLCDACDKKFESRTFNPGHICKIRELYVLHKTMI